MFTSELPSTASPSKCPQNNFGAPSDGMQIREELNRLGNNFNQAIKRLNAVNQISDIRNWIASFESRQGFERIQIYDNWRIECGT